MTKQISSNKDSRLSRRKRMMGWSFLIMVLSVVLMPLGGYVYTDVISTANAADQTAESNPRANYWRAVRGGEEGYTDINRLEKNVLIQSAGENWRRLRNGAVATIGGYLVLISLLTILLYHLKSGGMKLDNGRSGKTITRWSIFDRIIHWTVASLFIILAITGLSMLFGRYVLIPVLGGDGFAAYASLAMAVHNYLGPLFVAVLVILILSWIKHNMINDNDIKWFKAGGGGIIGNQHVSCGRFNGGEKVWFWIVTLVGLTVGISGLILDFPNLEQVRSTMQNANLVHGALSIIWISIAFGHIYIGTLGSEGSLDGMLTGEVDENWAKQHHDLWYDEVMQDNDDMDVTGAKSSA
ncbi:MAG: formate dehydrogenase subunit gamma [Gammaproteobacteria bacterium]|nr:formate dehydrogenase subunit gamma [Gammaproteobacteria bacterium]